MPNAGALRLIARPTLPADGNLWNTPNLLLQKFPAPAFTATTKVTFTPRNPGDRTGLVVMGKTWSALELESTTSGVTLSQITRQHADQPGPRTSSSVIPVTGNSFYLRAAIEKGAMVHFSYSLDGEHFTPVGTPFQATVGIWIGAKIGLFATNTAARGEFGYADYDWFRIEP
jgi:beta-xylosidase